MDPITALIIFLIIAATGTAGASAAHLQKRHRHAQMQEAITAQCVVNHQLLSIFDVFWDLGASDFSLEVMAHQGIIPSSADALPATHARLRELVSDYGSYSDYINETLEIIREFHRDQNHLGSRRALPSLQLRHKKLLALPSPQKVSSNLQTRSQAPFQNAILAASHSERQMLRQHNTAAFQDTIRTASRAASLHTDSQLINVDDIAAIDTNKLLDSLFAGNIANEVQKWWKLRKLRTLKQDLDQKLSALYAFYADFARATPNFYQPLYDAHRRWRVEAERLAWLRRHRPWHDQDWAPGADVLVEQAYQLAHKLAQTAYDNVFESIERIHQFAREGNTAMAGYLIYLNQHAFFAGRAPHYSEYVRAIEYSTYHLQEELRNLQTKGVL